MDYDLCVIGGGINGVGIARDAAGRGLSVLLVEAQDLAGATSSASTKLIHGGLRYLEYYEFKLVKESLQERRKLLRAAPHLVTPMKFVLPHDENLRPYAMIKAGLFLYDWFGGRKSARKGRKNKLEKSQALDFAISPLADPLKSTYTRGFSYTDCQTDDARLVTINAVDAYERGAIIMPRTACVSLVPIQDKSGWQVHLQNMLNGDEFQITANMIVNAAGPWVRGLLENSSLATPRAVDNVEGGEQGEYQPSASDYVPHLRLVKGSHIVVPKLYRGDHSYLLQQPDGRVIFTIPYEKDYTLIGTTDVPFEGDASAVSISDEEVEYLCDAVNRSFKKKINAGHIMWSYSGVRSLLDDGNTSASKVSRDYKLYIDERAGPPILSVFGGKLTTYRKLAEHAVNRLATFRPQQSLLPWTDKAILPGGDMQNGDFEGFVQKQISRYTFLPEVLLRRYARAYGTRMSKILKGVNKIQDLGICFGDDVYEAEIFYMLCYEFAHTIEDVLWRRSKLGLHISDKTVQALEVHFPTLLAQVNRETDRYENASGY